jgi:hypothetical protein
LDIHYDIKALGCGELRGADRIGGGVGRGAGRACGACGSGGRD